MAKYNQDGGGGVGTATANPSPETASQQPTGAATANPGTAAPEAPKTPDAPKGDQAVYEAAKEKLTKDRAYRLTPEEAEAVRNVQKGKAKPGPKAEATPAPAPEAKAPEIPAPIKSAMERLKVEKPEDLATSIEKMQGEIQRLNGERGNLGPLQERLSSAQSTLETQQAIIRDLVHGDAKAMEWARKHADKLGIDVSRLKPAAPQAPVSEPAGEWSPDSALDVETAKYVKGLEGSVQQLKEELKALRDNTEKYGKFYETELEKQARESSLQGAVSLVQNLIDTEGVSGIYDRRHGPIGPFLQAFFKDPSGSYPQIQGVIELMRIANERKLDNLEDAYFIWQGKNRGKQAVAAAQAAPAPQMAPTAGLSDRQEGNSGRVHTGPTPDDVIAWTDGKKPIPREFIKNGRFDRKAIPTEVWAEVERRRGRK